MEMSFYAKTNLLWVIQRLVKKYDGRFVCNPYALYFNDKSRVTISFENIENANKFNRMVSITEQPYF